MNLSELCNYNKITIQCHDNPDPDALASGWGLTKYFKSQGRDTRFIYSGRFQITKSNLMLMLDKLDIPIEYCAEYTCDDDELLITTDCQYGQGNVSCAAAANVAVIDHHQGTPETKFAEVRPSLGSCSTLVWKLMKDEGYDFNNDKELSTALYYGLMTDTGNFSEIHHPLDKDMQDTLIIDKSKVTLFCNSNISVNEMVIAGDALVNYTFLEETSCGIIQAKPCDPNILGFISDLALQVDKFKVCIAFCEVPGGYKLSVRSCDKEVRANEFAEALTAGVGSGGGHIDKAGGFISRQKFDTVSHFKTISDFFTARVNEYFDSCEIIHADTYEIDASKLRKYAKKPMVFGYVDPCEFLKPNEHVVVRTLEGDADLTIEDDFYIMIGVIGEVWPIKKERFDKTYTKIADPYNLETEYLPTVHSETTGDVLNLLDYAKSCYTQGGSTIMAMPLTNTLKIFRSWYQEQYMLGKPGDFLACKEDDLHDIYIIRSDIFEKTYEEVTN